MSDSMTQCNRILKELKENPDGVANYIFPTRMGILQPNKRIQELRESGYPILAERQYMKGKATGTWIYRLAGLESKKRWFRW